MRGAPGAGKSTWVKQNQLEQYTLCPDDFRVLCSSLDLKVDGSTSLIRSQEVENIVWKLLFETLEFRMSRGEFTIIDATASKTKDILQYKSLAEQYRYKMYCIDFTNVPLDTCKIQNKQRPEYKWVPEKAIEEIYARFETQPVPAGVTMLQPEEFPKVLEKPIDMSTYKKIVFIGDIHGCYDTLMQYFKDGLRDDYEYIFLGDYLDRGNQNAEVAKWLLTIMDKPNVCLLLGNHERHISDYGHNHITKSPEFEKCTKPQLIAGGFTDRDARLLSRKFLQMSYISYKGIEVLACHGGIPTLQPNLLYVPTRSFINGVGSYRDSTAIAETWTYETKENQFQIHGHRNISEDPIRVTDRVFNLEGQVEFGGHLRIVELNEDKTWSTIELEDCQPIDENLRTEERQITTVGEAITYLRNNKYVKEKQLEDGVSSFNFTREAFWGRNWNHQTVLARGLFIDTVNNQIMARSYEKFFHADETQQTKINVLKNTLQFPVSAYMKENGFLAIVSYDYRKDDLFIASKSTTKGDYAGYIKTQLAPYKKKILEFLKDYYLNGFSLSLVFECIDTENDPHIIKYPEDTIILLDGIYNTLDYQTIPYPVLKDFAETKLGCPVKEKAIELEDWDQFSVFYSLTTKKELNYNYRRYAEGFVFVDATGFMIKCKTGYYNMWKNLRGIANQTLRCGYSSRASMLSSPIEKRFYEFCRGLYDNRNKETNGYPFKTDIISLREKFLDRNS